ncbi:MAG: hypothetical protein CMJ24_00940 [Phycisphaerae bacterium]|nr:hypothetical protein [Phycisphaerae bacterium]
MTTKRTPASVLFTAFEPSGDAHAAPMIAHIRKRYPDLEIVAWGGPRMAAAGATLMASTAEDGGMGLGGLARARMLYRERAAMKRWMADRRLLLHVGVDSPSANVRLAPVSKAAGAHYVQFVAPQYWAWAPWRLRKFKKLASEVLCILPFEEKWFTDRGMRARFVGHPVVNVPLDQERIAAERAALELPDGHPRVVILPGSRTAEIRSNMALLTKVHEGLTQRHPGLAAVIVAAKPELLPLIRETLGGALPENVTVVQQDGLQGCLDWAEFALCTSGTISLDLARQRVPMVGVYHLDWVSMTGSKVMIKTEHRLLPNIIATRRIVPEFVPYRGSHEPILQIASEILGSKERLARMGEALGAVIGTFGSHDAGAEAGEALEAYLGDA